MQIHICQGIIAKKSASDSEPKAKSATSTLCPPPNEQSCKNWRAFKPSRNSASASSWSSASSNSRRPHRRTTRLRCPPSPSCRPPPRPTTTRRPPRLPGPDGRVEAGEHTPGALGAGLIRSRRAGPEHPIPRAHVTTDQTTDGDFCAAPRITDVLPNDKVTPHDSDRAPGDPATRQLRPRPLTVHTGHVFATIPDPGASVCIFKTSPQGKAPSSWRRPAARPSPSSNLTSTRERRCPLRNKCCPARCGSLPILKTLPTTRSPTTTRSVSASTCSAAPATSRTTAPSNTATRPASPHEAALRVNRHRLSIAYRANRDYPNQASHAFETTPTLQARQHRATSFHTGHPAPLHCPVPSPGP